MRCRKWFARTMLLCLLAGILYVGSVSIASAAGLIWPAGQLLPSFSTPASPLDAISLESATVHEAEGGEMSHRIGRLQGDGWSANTAQDSPGHLVYGPYDTTLSAGNLIATYRMMVDDNTFDNGNVVAIDVYDATAGQVLASLTITRKQFRRPWLYQDFKLFFTNTAGHAMEFRVWWYDISYVRMDRIAVTAGPFKSYNAITQLSHGVGRQDGDGWSANTAQDGTGHLIYGPYDTVIPAGYYTAAFKMLIDNNTSNDDQVVQLDVRDATAGAVLKSQYITRKQFTAANQYHTFDLAFYSPGGHSMEFRVYWLDKAYIKVNAVSLINSNDDEKNLFVTLAGLVNRTEPRLYTASNDLEDGGKYAWLNDLNLSCQEIDGWEALAKYRNEIAGIVVYDPAQPHTLNLATTIAGLRDGIVAAPNLVARLVSAPYNLPIIEDLRWRFSDKYQVYQYMYDNYWPQCTHRILAGMPGDFAGCLRDYVVATKAAVFWLDPNDANDRTMAVKFLSEMTPGAGIFAGWWPQEQGGVNCAGQYGIPTVAADWFENATVYGGLSRQINIPAIPAKPLLQNKIYITMALSDGDNAQYCEHFMRQLWRDPGRGGVPIGWTASAPLVDMAPQMLNWYYQTATANDCLISGPSGMGYCYPDQWTDANRHAYMQYSDTYLRMAGFRVITPWGNVTDAVGNDYATYLPSLLGVHSQDSGRGNVTFQNTLPLVSYKVPYDGNIANIKAALDSAGASWSGQSPLFVAVQAVAWEVTPSALKALADTYDPNRYVFVRPDHFFMLYREANKLPVYPLAPFATGLETNDLLPTWSDTIDWSMNVSGYFSTIIPECSIRQETAHTGARALMYSGTANGGAETHVYFKAFNVRLPIAAATSITYWIYPEQDNGRYVAVDFHCTDGTILRDSLAVDQNGFRMHPNAGHGGSIPLHAWSEIRSDIGQVLAGKTIDKIWIAFDRPGATGQFRGYIDDIRIAD